MRSSLRSFPYALQPPPPPERFVALLFDDLNLSPGDMIQAQKAATKILDGSRLPSDMAAILSTSGTDSGFTFDHNGLEKTILSLKVNRLYQHDPNDCPNVDYYQGDLIVNKEDPTALDAATSDALACANLDPSMRRVAVQLALAAVYALASLPKQYIQVRLAGGRVLTGTISNANNDTFLVRSHILGDGHTVRHDQLAEPPRPVLAIGTKAVKGLEVTGIVALCIVAIPLFVALYPLILAGVIPD